MYNAQKIYQLLEDRKLKHKDLLDYLGKNQNGSLNQLLRGDLKASNVEKIADFFGLPVDFFFDRNPENSGVNISGNRNHVHDFSINHTLAAENKNLEALIEEKDKRIRILEEMIELLKKDK